jgi:hypothetical protein
MYDYKYVNEYSAKARELSQANVSNKQVQEACWSSTMNQPTPRRLKLKVMQEA